MENVITKNRENVYALLNGANMNWLDSPSGDAGFFMVEFPEQNLRVSFEGEIERSFHHERDGGMEDAPVVAHQDGEEFSYWDVIWSDMDDDDTIEKPCFTSEEEKKFFEDIMISHWC